VANATIHNKSHKQCILSQFSQQHCYASLKKPYTLAGFEPRSTVLKADAMTTAPRRHARAFLFELL
jgi:hypothetical protein